MKNGTIFWGTFLISFGILLLLHSLGMQIWGIEYAGKLWPLLIIFWGVSLLKINKLFSSLLTAFTALLLALFLASLFYNHGCCWQFENKEGCREDKTEYFVSSTDSVTSFSSEYDESIKEAKFYIDGGAAVYHIADTTEKTIDIFTDNPEHDFKFTVDKEKSVYTLDMTGVHVKNIFKNKKSGRVATIKLNKNVLWDLDFNIGASEIEGDLSQYKVSRLDIDAGAASIELKLGDLADVCKVTIDAGASSVKLMIPASSGCRINSETGLSDEDFNGFTNSEGVYTTENYNNTNKVVNIEISGGVSSFEVVRY